MWKIVIFAAVLLVLRVLYFFLNHETLFPISRKTVSVITSRGAFHYTSKETAREICLQQKMNGYPDKKSTFPGRRSRRIVWLLLNEDSAVQRFCRWLIVKRHCPNRPTGRDRSVRYEAKLLITAIRPGYTKNMYYNLEGGIGCYADSLESVTIVPAPLDATDRKLGIMSQEELSAYLKQ